MSSWHPWHAAEIGGVVLVKPPGLATSSFDSHVFDPIYAGHVAGPAIAKVAGEPHVLVIGGAQDVGVHRFSPRWMLVNLPSKVDALVRSAVHRRWIRQRVHSWASLRMPLWTKLTFEWQAAHLTVDTTWRRGVILL